MSKIRITQFMPPVKGYDNAWPNNNQAELTTGKISNCRCYDSTSGRQRIASRPGLDTAYTQQSGNSAIQAINYLDYGFGDYVTYVDSLDGASIILNEYVNTDAGSTYWPLANAALQVTGGHAETTTVADAGNVITTQSAGALNALSGDSWELFELNFKYYYGLSSTTKAQFWVSSVAEAGTDGVLLTIETGIVWHPVPINTSTTTVTVTATSGSNTSSWSTLYHMGGHYKRPGVPITVIGGKDTVTVRFGHWGDIITVDRDYGTCDKASWAIGRKNDIKTYTGATDTIIFAEVSQYELDAESGSTDNKRQMIVISNNNLYREDPLGTIGSTSQFSGFTGVDTIDTCAIGGMAIITDGKSPVVWRPREETGTTLQTTRGAIPQDVTICVNWRNRLVVSGSKAEPTNIFFSRMDVPFDFEYGEDDAMSAIALNQTENGRLGTPVTALMPMSEEQLIIGCESSIWALKGDPLAGGVMYNISREAGCLNFNSWCQDESGMLYILGKFGLYKSVPGQHLENISINRVQDLTNIDTSANFVFLTYDAERIGVMIHITSKSTNTGSHYFYDIRLDAFMPESYATTTNPSCGIYYQATDTDYRKLLLGGKDGYIYTMKDSSKNDITGAGSTSAIDSYALIGPKRWNDLEDTAVITRMVIECGKSDDTVEYETWSADTMEGLLTGDTICTGTIGAGRNVELPRSRGGALGVYISNSTVDEKWSVDAIAATVRGGGREH